MLHYGCSMRDSQGDSPSRIGLWLGGQYYPPNLWLPLATFCEFLYSVIIKTLYMPRRYANFRKRRPMRKRRLRKTRYTVYGSARFLARKALSGLRYVKGLVNSEMFKIDNVYASTSIGAAGQVAPLTNVAQGDGPGGRTGNSILVRSVNIKGSLTWNTSSALQTVCVLLVQDNQQVYDAPSPVISGGDQGILTTYSPWSHLNPTTLGRFSILYRHNFTLNSQYPQINFQINKPMMHHVRYNGVNANDISRGGLSLIFICSDTLNPSLFNINARTSYRDN